MGTARGALFTKAMTERLLSNGQARMANPEVADFRPVVKLFGGSAHTYLISEADPDDNDLLFGLCDTGMGFPELGYIRRSELEGMRFPVHVGGLGTSVGGLPLERDKWFKASAPLSAYVNAARRAGRIVDEPHVQARIASDTPAAGQSLSP